MLWGEEHIAHSLRWGRIEVIDKMTQLVSLSKQWRGNKGEVVVTERKNLQKITKQLRIHQTPWEAKLWYYLRGGRFLGLKFKRQVPMGKYVADFCCQEKKLIIELDGGGHNEDEALKFDLIRESYLKGEGYNVLRFWNNDVDSNIEGVLEVVRKSLS